MTTSEVSMIVMACAAALAAVTHAIPRITAGWRDRTRAERVTADTVKGVFRTMEIRITAMETEHSACLLSLIAVREVNAGQERRIQVLEARVAQQADIIARYERALAQGEAERVDLQRAIEAGDRRPLRRSTGEHSTDDIARALSTEQSEQSAQQSPNEQHVVDAIRVDIVRSTTTDDNNR